VSRPFGTSTPDPGILKSYKATSYGKTNTGRYLFIVWVMAYRKTKIITAREMTAREKQFYKRSKK
jgi:uncharacterized DUF497 family protein